MHKGVDSQWLHQHYEVPVFSLKQRHGHFPFASTTAPLPLPHFHPNRTRPFLQSVSEIARLERAGGLLRAHTHYSVRAKAQHAQHSTCAAALPRGQHRRVPHHAPRAGSTHPSTRAASMRPTAGGSVTLIGATTADVSLSVAYIHHRRKWASGAAPAAAAPAAY